MNSDQNVRQMIEMWMAQAARAAQKTPPRGKTHTDEKKDAQEDEQDDCIE